MDDHKRLTFVRLVFTGSLCCSILLSFVNLFEHTGWATITFILIILTLAAWPLLGFLHRRRKPFGWVLALAALNLLVMVPELALRLAGFRYEFGIQFGYPRPTQFVRYVPDKDLLWKYPSSRPDVNSLGFRGDETVMPKPHDVYRILFLGDSCTELGYPEQAEFFLNSNPVGDRRRFECVNLGMIGYSSYQGRVLAERYASKLDPDLAVVYFGWNDHWNAYGAIDSEKVVNTSTSAWTHIARLFYRRSRLIQAGGWLLDTLVRPASSQALDQVRVPPNQYQENLLRIKELFESIHVPVVFITAPTSHYRLGVPDYTVNMNFARDKQSAITMHKKYNDLVRCVGQGPTAYVLDLESDFNDIQDPQQVFQWDGIHFTSLGQVLAAQRIARFIQTNILVPAEDR